MSKDFGIAGIRCGYAITNKQKVSSLIKSGYLWNVNNFANYFISLYVNKEFQDLYEKCRIYYILNTKEFYNNLLEVKSIKVFPSKANFFLIKIPESFTSTEFMLHLLSRYGIYVRDCNDKIGLTKNMFIRLASRKKEENDFIINCLKEIS
jgi:histidinol-phosphate/aromatic aminotransferase/cobyric acid decarboxylase-like protein